MTKTTESAIIPAGDLSRMRWMTLPAVAAFLLLGLIGTAEGAGWLYWVMFVGGWYLSSLINWHSYRHYVLRKAPPERANFYAASFTGQGIVILMVVGYLWARFAI